MHFMIANIEILFNFARWRCRGNSCALHYQHMPGYCSLRPVGLKLAPPPPPSKLITFKGTQDWEFFWLRFWNLPYFFVSYIKILRFYKKNFLIWPLLGEVRFFRVVLGLRGMKKNFELGKKIFFFFLQLWSLNMTQISFFENSIN